MVNLSKYGQAELHRTAYFPLEQAQVVFHFCPAQVKDKMDRNIYVYVYEKLFFSKQHQNKKEEIDYLQNTFFGTKNPTLHQNYKGLLDLTVTMPVFHWIPFHSYLTSANRTLLMPTKRKQSYFLPNNRFSCSFLQSLCLHGLCWLYSTTQHFKTWIPIRATLIKNMTFHLLWSTANINYILL